MGSPLFTLWEMPSAYIVRYGDTHEGNLNESGRQAAEAIHNFFEWQPVGRVICSDVPAAYATAQYILNTGNVACPFVATIPDLEHRVSEFAQEPYEELPTVMVIRDEQSIVPGGVVAIYGDVRVTRLGAI